MDTTADMILVKYAVICKSNHTLNSTKFDQLNLPQYVYLPWNTPVLQFQDCDMIVASYVLVKNVGPLWLYIYI